jgi:ferric-dicitrate binding protein FerR (iron transport regulator)
LYAHGTKRGGQVHHADAALELNSDGRKPIVLADPALASICIRGLFVTGDSANVAQAGARTFHLRAENPAQQIVLAPRASALAP